MLVILFYFLFVFESAGRLFNLKQEFFWKIKQTKNRKNGNISHAFFFINSVIFFLIVCFYSESVQEIFIIE